MHFGMDFNAYVMKDFNGLAYNAYAMESSLETDVTGVHIVQILNGNTEDAAVRKDTQIMKDNA